MSGRRTRRALGLAGALLAFAVPVAQAASPAAERAADEVFQDYATDGRIDPCRHSTKTLELARDNVTPDVEQYASEYPDAIEAAIAARARGACANTAGGGGGGGGAGAAPAAPATTPAPAPSAARTPVPQAGAPTETVVPNPPAPAGAGTTAPVPPGGDRALERAASARPDADAPLPLVALGILIGLTLLLGLLVLAARRLGLGDDRLAPVGHAVREARWRWRGTWDDFGDWLRQGR